MGQGSDIDEQRGDEVDAKGSGGEYSVGDVIWLKIHGGLWWPGKIVGGINASEGRNSRNTADGKVRVRVYGSYEYLYVDPAKSSAEFETILQRKNSNHTQIFEESLNQSISSARRYGLKGQESKRRESRKITDSKQQKKRKEITPSSPGIQQAVPDAVLSGNSSQPSARVIRVMRRLGLCAPAGSPFGKN